MPYIPPTDRIKFNKLLEINKVGRSCDTPGELNYLITALVRAYVGRRGENYTGFNEVVGVLECAKLEMYRRMAAPYEDEKCMDNGDVY